MTTQCIITYCICVNVFLSLIVVARLVVCMCVCVWGPPQLATQSKAQQLLFEVFKTEAEKQTRAAKAIAVRHAQVLSQTAPEQTPPPPPHHHPTTLPSDTIRHAP